MSGIIVALTGRRQVGKSHIADHLVNDLGFVRLHPFNPGKAGCRAMYEAMGATPEQARRMTDTDLKDVPVAFLPRFDEQQSSSWSLRMARAFVSGYLGYMGADAELSDALLSGERSGESVLPNGYDVRDFLAEMTDYVRDELWVKPGSGDIRSPKTKYDLSNPEATDGHYTSRHVMEKIGQHLGVVMGPEWTLYAEISVSEKHAPNAAGKVVESIVYEAAGLRQHAADVGEDIRIVRVTADGEKPIESPESDAFVQGIREDAIFHNPMTGISELGVLFDESMRQQGILLVHEDTPQP